MGARAVVFSAVCATYLVIACATGGGGEATEGGTENPESSVPVDSSNPPDETSTGNDTGSPDDTGSGTDSFVGSDSSSDDSFIPPSDAGGPTDTGISDSFTPPMDVVVATPKCSLFKIKYAAEYSILGESAVPCSLGCTSGQCCWHGVTPPVCLAK